ncbi:TPA: transposase [Salmonella enterica]|uniref:Transposase n=1 Tax=Salmonella enterica TaxID=28901 RepID=A0A759H2Y1_SALER|nr:transposase [Salmonella enterica]
MLWSTGDGLCLLTKRLEHGRSWQCCWRASTGVSQSGC